MSEIVTPSAQAEADRHITNVADAARAATYYAKEGDYLTVLECLKDTEYRVQRARQAIREGMQL